jgi:hypothetical protein
MYTHRLAYDPYPVGVELSSKDLEPTGGTRVRSVRGLTVWRRTNDYEGPCNWYMEPDGGDYETWTKVAGNYGPVTVIESPDQDEMELARRWMA